MKKLFCVYCGTENKIDKKRCKKCFRKLQPQDHLLLEYLKSKVKENCEDNFFSIIKSYIKSHLYGVLVTCSIIVSAITTVVNVTNNQMNFEIVTKKPTEITMYTGANLAQEQIVEKYIEAVKSGNETNIKNLKLETFYPEVKKKIENQSLKETEIEPILGNEYSKNGAYFYKEVQEEHNIFKANPVYGAIDDYYINWYGEYQTFTYEFSLLYCSHNKCGEEETVDSMIGVPSVIIRIQLILLDGNYYVLGDELYDGILYNYLVGKLLLKHKGNTNQFSFMEIDYAMNTCYDPEECLKALKIIE